jgi:adenine-specific DNA methylase
MVAIEYYCEGCKVGLKGRLFKKPDSADVEIFHKSQGMLGSMEQRFVPEDQIPEGDESSRLVAWGYRRYRDMFNARQLIGLELSCRHVVEEENTRNRTALATNLSDLLRYQNMLCRYDTMALKSLDIFSVHGFPVGLLRCESNLLGIRNKSGKLVGSGGWRNIVEKYSKAKEYCENPFEWRFEGARKVLVPTPGEWIGERRDDPTQPKTRDISLSCGSATALNLEPDSLDAVLTDPPYFGNVQYAELMDFCYVWLRKIMRSEAPIFGSQSTRNPDELTGNQTMDRGLAHFTIGMSTVFQLLAEALKPMSPLAFTYHHNQLEAYHPIAVAILDSGLTCTATLPCPAEMEASIHINGTGSSIIDTVFVCRKLQPTQTDTEPKSNDDLVRLVRNDTDALKAAGYSPSRGDLRCITYGHVTRVITEHLRPDWNKANDVTEKLKTVRELFGESITVEVMNGVSP